MAENNGALPAIKDSVQDVTFKKDEVFAPGSAGSMWLIPPFDASSVLPAWGTPYRDYVLRTYARAMHNTLFMATLNNLASEIASTPWQLYGKRNKDSFQKLILNAEFGSGWRSFCRKFVNAYGVYDFGVPIEIIGRGDALKPVSGQVEGFSILDPLYCELTGNVEYPIIFRSQRGGYHRLHTTRVRRIVDAPQVDRDFYGRGMSALSRFFGTAWLQILMGKYHVEKLSDLPPAGIVLLNNIAGDFKDVVRQYEADRRADGQNVWRNMLEFQSYDQNKATIDFISFSELPDGFDYDTWQKHHINLVALSIGVDPQDVAPLSGAALGTGAQSFVLDAKSRRKAPGLILKELETFINLDVLPAYLEFKFIPRDEEGELREAETAQAWVNVANSVPGLSEEQKLQLLVAKVQAIQDVATDKQGNLLYGDSDLPAGEDGDIVPADDTTMPGTEVGAGAPSGDTEAPVEGDAAPVESTDSTAATEKQIFGYHLDAGVVTINEARAQLGLPPLPDQEVDELQQLKSKADVLVTLTQGGIPTKDAAEMVGIILPEDSTADAPAPPPNRDAPPAAAPVVQSGAPDEKDVRKSYSSTRDDFESAIAATINSAVAGELTRVRAGIIVRAELDKFGRRAMLDGLADGGTVLDALEGDDLKTFNSWRVEQSAYVATLMTDIFKDGAEPNGEARARIWSNKSLNTIYQKGLLSADANGFYEWVYGGTIKHCSTCAKNVGLIMRLKQWHEKDCLPQGDCLECGGFNCLCKLKRRRKKMVNWLPGLILKSA